MLKLKLTYDLCKIICVLIGCQLYNYVQCITRLIALILDSTATWYGAQISVASSSPLKPSQRKAEISSISTRRRNEVCLVVKYEFCRFDFVYLYIYMCTCVLLRVFIHVISYNSNLKTDINKAVTTTNRSIRNTLFNHNDIEDA
jgi:hypothetical protein